MNRYETVFIMTPVLSAEQVAETVKKYRASIASNGGKIVHEDAWGLKKLAYPIQKKSSGFYHLIEWEAEGTAVLPTLPTRNLAATSLTAKKKLQLRKRLQLKQSQ